MGESAVVAILPLRMEVIYCTSGFFVAISRQAILLSMFCLSRLDTRTHLDYHARKTHGKEHFRRLC